MAGNKESLRRIGDLESGKADQLSTVYTSAPSAGDGVEGEERICDVDHDGTLYKYRKINGEWYRYQYAKV